MVTERLKIKQKCLHSFELLSYPYVRLWQYIQAISSPVIGLLVFHYEADINYNLFTEDV